MNTITRYLRDGTQMNLDDWKAALHMDMTAHVDAGNSLSSCPVMFDLYNREKVILNNTTYEIRVDYVFDSATAVMELVANSGRSGSDVVADMLLSLPEELAAQLIPYIPDMTKDDQGKFVLVDSGKHSPGVRYDTWEER